MVFHMFQAKQLGGFAFALVLNAELIRFSRNNKGAKICVEFSSIPFGGCVFFCFYFGARNLWKNTARAMFLDSLRGYSQFKLQMPQLVAPFRFI